MSEFIYILGTVIQQPSGILVERRNWAGEIAELSRVFAALTNRGPELVPSSLAGGSQAASMCNTRRSDTTSGLQKTTYICHTERYACT